MFLRASQGQAMRLKLTRASAKMSAEGTLIRAAPTTGASRGACAAAIKALDSGC